MAGEASQLIDQLQAQLDAGAPPLDPGAGFAGGRGVLPALGGLAELFSLPKHGVQSVLGQGAHLGGLTPQQGQAGFQDLIARAAKNPLLARLLAGPGATPQQSGELFAGLVADQATDPLNTIGLGIPRSLGWGRLAAVDEGIQTALSGAIAAPFKATGAVLSRVPAPGAKVLETLPTGQTQTRDAKSIADWISAIPARYQHKLRERGLANAVQSLQAAGHDLDVDVAEYLSREAPQYPGSVGGAKGFLVNLATHLDQAVAGQSDPRLQAAGRQLIQEVRTRVGRIWEDAAVAREEALAKGLPAAPGDQVFEDAVSEAFGRSVRLYESAQAALGGFARHGLDQALPAGELPRRVSQLVDQREQSLGVLADLPGRMQGPIATDFGDFIAKYGGLTRDRRAFEKGLREAWDRSPAHQGQPFPTLQGGNPEDFLANANAVLAQLGGPQVANSVDLIEALRPLVSSTTFRNLDDILRRQGDDILTADPYDVVQDRVVRAIAANYGIRPPKGVKEHALALADKGMSAFKTQALLAPAYLVTNLLSGLALGAGKGVNPATVLSNYARNLKAAATGGDLVVGPVRELSEAFGVKPPVETTAAAAGVFGDISPAAAYSGKGQDVFAGQGTFLAGAGALAGGYSGFTGAEEGEKGKGALQGAVTGAATGAAVPVLSKFLLQRLGGALETTMRQVAWAKGFEDAVTSAPATARLRTIVADALTAGEKRLVPGPPRGVARATATPQQVDQVMQALEGQGYRVSADDLEDLLSGSGLVSPERARAAAKQWGEVLDTANQMGVRLSTAIHFDYQDLNNVEALVREVSPFATWAMKAYPYFAEAIATHPVIVNVLHDLHTESGEQVESRGLTQRFTGSLVNGPAGQLMSALLGRPVESFHNPLKGLVPFGDATRAAGAADDEEPLAAAIRMLGGLGFGLRPDLEAALRVSGLTGEDAPARGYFRLGEAVRSATGLAGVNEGRGIDLNAPVTDLERGARQAVTGRAPTDLTEAAIGRRIDELAVRDTGLPLTSGDAKVAQHVRAKLDRTGPIYEQARDDVLKERNVRGVGSYTAGQFFTPQALLTPEESQIRRTQAEHRPLPRELTDPLREAARETPQAPAPPELIDRVREVALGFSKDGVLPQSVAAAFSRGTVKDLAWVVGEIDKEATNRQPLLRGYSASGSPEESKLHTLLTTYNSLPALLANDADAKDLPPEVLQVWADLARQEQARKRANFPMQKRPQVPTAANRAATMLQQRQEALRAQHPVLDAYLNYAAEREGTGSVDDFFATVWKKTP